MGIITKGMGAIMKGAKKRKTLTISSPTSKPKPPLRKGEVIIKKKSKPSKTKLSDTWQGRRVDAMNRKIKKSWGRGRAAMTEKYIDEHGAVTSSKAPTKKLYKSIQRKWHSLSPDQQSEVYMKKAKRDPKSFYFDKKKFGKK
jgi:hypothetical protein